MEIKSSEKNRDEIKVKGEELIEIIDGISEIIYILLMSILE